MNAGQQMVGRRKDDMGALQRVPLVGISTSLTWPPLLRTRS